MKQILTAILCLTVCEVNTIPSSFAQSADAMHLENARSSSGSQSAERDLARPHPTVSSFWSLGGNKGTTAGKNFLGTTDNQALDFKVDGQRALRLEPNATGAPNVIGGASVNFIAPGSFGATIGGGGAPLPVQNFTGSLSNSVGYSFATVGGGLANTVQGFGLASTIAGGFSNSIGQAFASISGGRENTVNGQGSFVGGGEFNVLETGANFSTISGGANNKVQSDTSACSIGGGSGNLILSNASSCLIAGGDANIIGAGCYNSTIGGGINNLIESRSQLSFVAGGDGNDIGANVLYGAIGGGSGNGCGGLFTTVPGGKANFAGGDYSFAAGHGAKALHPGAFVWADSTEADVYSTANNQFLVRASGGMTCYTSPSLTSGAVLAAGSGTWSSLSDQNAKENFQAVDTRDLLARIATLTVSTWNYKTQDKSIRHLGPMAQDFYRAFNIGEDNRHITTVDESGVALAAIQGLNQKLEEQSTQLQQRDKEVRELEDNVAELKGLVARLIQQNEARSTKP